MRLPVVHFLAALLAIAPARAQTSPYQTFSPSPLREVETDAFLARGAAAGAPRADFIDDYIVALDTLVRAGKAHGWWAQRDAIWLLAAPNLVTARLNLKGPAPTMSQPNMMLEGNFTAYRGLAYDGATQFSRTNYIPSTFGGLFTQDSANVSVWLTDNASAAPGKYFFGAASLRVALDGNMSAVVQRINSAATDAPAPYADSSTGMLSVNRSGPNAVQVYHSGSLIQTTATASAPVDTYGLTLGGNVAGQFAPVAVAYAAIGGALTPQQIADETADVADYLTSVGALPNRLYIPRGTDYVLYNTINGISYPIHADTVNKPYAYQRSAASNLHRFELRQNDQFLATQYRSGDELGHSDRNEIVSKLRGANGIDHWVAFDLLFSSLPAQNTATWGPILTQEHPIGGVFGPTDAPQWALTLDQQNRMSIVVNAHGTANRPRWTASAPVEVGRWYRIVLRLRSHPTAGEYDLYINGALASSGTGLAMGYAGDAPYHVFGLYRQANAPETYVAYFANIQETFTGSLLSRVLSPTGRLPQLKP